MKQTKKLTRSQKIFLQKYYGVDPINARLVTESPTLITVMLPDGSIVDYSKVVH